jgi:hypothetical protein
MDPFKQVSRQSGIRDEEARTIWAISYSLGERRLVLRQLRETGIGNLRAL